MIGISKFVPIVFAGLTVLLLCQSAGEVLVRLKTGAEDEPLLRLGRDYALDGDLAELLTSLPGIANVSLGVRRGIGNLRLVA